MEITGMGRERGQGLIIDAIAFQFLSYFDMSLSDILLPPSPLLPSSLFFFLLSIFAC
jgi:hypothetical protein